MSLAVSSALPLSTVPQPVSLTNTLPDPPQTASEPSAAAAPAPSSSAVLSEATLGALVAQQTAPATSDQSGASAPLDLKGQDLRKVDLSKLDLKGADLSGADLSGADLSGLDLTGANLTGADLSGATLTAAKLDQVSAQGADFSGAKLTDTTMNGADFTDADFSKSTVQKTYANWLGQGAKGFTNVTLNGANFQGATLSFVDFGESSAVNANFSNLNSHQAGFTGSNLTGASFDHATGLELSFLHSDLTNASLTNLDSKMRKAIDDDVVTGARFAGSSLDDTMMAQVKLSDADLTGIVRSAQGSWFNVGNYDGVDFSGFNFSGSSFDGDPGGSKDKFTVNGTNFSNAIFNNALFAHIDLTGGIFTGATFSHTDFQTGTPGELAGVAGIRFGDHYQLPQGSDADADGSPSLIGASSASTKGSAPGSKAASDDGKATEMAQALKTLEAINDQLDEARKATAKNGSASPAGPVAPDRGNTAQTQAGAEGSTQAARSQVQDAA